MAEGEPYAAAKQAQYVTIVNHFYDLVTDFYEYGWGHSFHFATRFKGETMREATARFEHFIALRLGSGQDFTFSTLAAVSVARCGR